MSSCAFRSHGGFRSARALFIVALFSGILSVGGCKTLATSDTEVAYNLFYTPADHIEELLEVGNVDGASAVYNEERSYFSENKDEKAAEDLRATLFERIGPRVSRTLAEIDGVKWPTGRAEWPRIKRAILKANEVKSEIFEHKILDGVRTDIPEYKTLIGKLGSLRNRVRRDASKEFQEYDIAGEPSFFEAFPVALEPPEFIAQLGGAWERKLEALTSADLRGVFAAYGSTLPDAAAAALATAHYAKTAEENRKPDAPPFFAMYEGVRLTRDAGLPLRRIPEDVVVYHVHAPADARGDEREFAVALDVERPFSLYKNDLDQSLTNSVASRADYLVLVDVVSTTTNQTISSVTRNKSEYEYGTKTVPNPDYNMAQNQLNQAQVEHQQAIINKASVDNQYCYGYGCIAKALAQVAAAASVAERRDKVEQAMSALSNTPITIEEPTYENYHFNVANLTLTKEAVLNVFVVNESQKYFNREFVIREDMDFRVAYNVSDSDRNIYSIRSKYKSEEDVISYSEDDMAIAGYRLFYALQRAEDKRKGTFYAAEIMSAVREDRRTSVRLASVKRNESVPKADPRFSHVVVILTPDGSLGTGFYVERDLVLTNRHVVEGSRYAELKTFDGHETFGKVVASDAARDLALLKVQRPGEPVTFFDGGDLPLGGSVEAIGHPKGLVFSISRGIVSGVRRFPMPDAPATQRVRLIQTDTPINTGNSGGPLFLGDAVIGVNTLSKSKDESEGLGFAVHYSEVLQFLRANGFSVGRRS